MITYNEKRYAFDFKKINKFLFDDKSGNELEITEGYEVDEKGEVNLISKVTREIKNVGGAKAEGVENIKYDMMKLFISVLITKDGGGDLDDEPDFGLSLAFNTMLTEGYIYEIK